MLQCYSNLERLPAVLGALESLEDGSLSGHCPSSGRFFYLKSVIVRSIVAQTRIAVQ